MVSPEAQGWNKLIEAVAKSLPDARERIMPPTPPAELAAYGKSADGIFPPSLLSLYAETNGLDVSGYLPDRYSMPNCTFSLIPATEVREWYATMLQNHGASGRIWAYFPHWLKTCSADGERDGIWHSKWIPFATDGAAGLQFISTGIRSGIYQYSPETFGIRRCGRSLAGYLTSVAKNIQKGSMTPFDSR